MIHSKFPVVATLILLAACQSDRESNAAPKQTAAPAKTAASSTSAKSTDAKSTDAKSTENAHTVPAAPIAQAPSKSATEPAAPDDSPAGRLTQIRKDYDAAMQGYYDAINAAKNEEEFRSLKKATKAPDVEPIRARARALIDEDPASPVALDALSWLLLRARSETDRPELFALVEKHHLQDDALAKMAGGLANDAAGGGRDFVANVMSKSTNPKVRGTAIYSLATAILNDIESAKEVQAAKTDEEKQKLSERYGDDRIAVLKSLDVEAQHKQAEALIEQTVKEFADVPYGKTTLGARAGADLFEMHNLAVGKVAPDIEGEDLDAKQFRLSDYRGKIVLLDFWGNW